MKNIDLFFNIVLCLFLMSFSWNNNVSSWGVVCLCVFILFTPISTLKYLPENKIYLLLICYFIYFTLPFLIIQDEGIKYSFISDNLPFLLFPIILFSRFHAQAMIKKNDLLLIFALGTTVGFFVCFFYAMYRFWNEFYLFLNGYEPVTMLVGMHPAYFSLFLSFSFAIVLNDLVMNHRNFSTVKKTLLVFWILVLAFGIFYIRSRTGVASFVFVVIFLILYRAPRKLKIVLVGSFLICLLLIYTFVHISSFHKGRFQVDQIVTGIDKKQKQWQASFNVIKQNPLFGISVIRAQRELNKQYALIGFEEGVAFSYNSHNQFLSTLIQGGLVGFVLLFAPFFLLFYRGLRQNDLLIIAFFLLTTLAFLTESMLYRHKGIIFYVTFLSLLGNESLPFKRMTTDLKDTKSS